MNRRDVIKSAGALSLATLLPSAVAENPPAASAMRIQRLSWAGIKLQTSKTTVLIDPWITPASLGDAWKEPVVPITVETDRRWVLLTHLHNDHFDPAAIRSVVKESGFAVLALDSKAAAVGSRGFRVYPVRSFEPVALGDVTMTAVPAVDGFNETQVSWIVSGGGKRIFHGGDTLWHGSFWAYGRQYGPFDAAFLPINGAKLKSWEPFSDVEGTMTPKQAVAAAVILGAKLLVPIHYGFNDPESYLEHPNAVGEFEETARARKQPFRALRPGEWLEI